MVPQGQGFGIAIIVVVAITILTKKRLEPGIVVAGSATITADYLGWMIPPRLVPKFRRPMLHFPLAMLLATPWQRRGKGNSIGRSPPQSSGCVLDGSNHATAFSK